MDNTSHYVVRIPLMVLISGLLDKQVCAIDSELVFTALQVAPQAVPEAGSILVSHPLVHPKYFLYQTVTLICHHSLTGGAYGLTLNRLFSTRAKPTFQGIHPVSWLPCLRPQGA